MAQFDKVTMQRTNTKSKGVGSFKCISNTVYETNGDLDKGDVEFFNAHGYVFDEISEDHVDIYVPRYSIPNLTRATEAFYHLYIA